MMLEYEPSDARGTRGGGLSGHESRGCYGEVVVGGFRNVIDKAPLSDTAAEHGRVDRSSCHFSATDDHIGNRSTRDPPPDHQSGSGERSVLDELPPCGSRLFSTSRAAG